MQSFATTRFARPVTIRLSRNSHDQTVVDAVQASQILMRKWPRDSAKRQAAMSECLRVLRGEAPSPIARRALWPRRSRPIFWLEINLLFRRHSRRNEEDARAFLARNALRLASDMRRWLDQAWTLLKESIAGFITDNAFSHGAAMAFYAVTSLAPVLLVVVAIAGLAFGNDAARIALSAQIAGLMGSESAELLKAALESASNETAGTWATVVGLVTLLITASGVFGEMQLALNTIWKVQPSGNSLSRLLRARAVSLGLVAALGFLLLVSLAASAAVTAFGDLLNAALPFGEAILAVINGIVSFVLIAFMFGAIYKVLPDRTLEWRDVAVGAIATAALFTIGKSLIGWYIGSSAIASSYGAAGGLLVTLLWVYYSSVIFLLGAEFTRAYSLRHGSRKDLAPLVRDRGGIQKERMLSSARKAESDRTNALATALLFLVWAVAAIIPSRSGKTPTSSAGQRQAVRFSKLLSGWLGSTQD